jgi:soluble lytic murein transglycosylase-like protein
VVKTIGSGALAAALLSQPATALDAQKEAGLEGLIAQHAKSNGVPADLVHRVIKRESRYNPRAVGRGGAMGLMQIKHATARGVGYTGSAAGLLDAETNLTYAVRYLAGAYQAAGGNQSRAVALYASGYHGRGMVTRRAPRQVVADTWGSQAAPVALRDDAMVVRGYR